MLKNSGGWLKGNKMVTYDQNLEKIVEIFHEILTLD